MILLAIAGLTVSGCSQGLSSVPGSDRAVSKDTSNQVIDAGTVEETAQVHFSFDVRAPRKIKAIQRSCGCTTVGLKEGQVIHPGERLSATVDLRSKRPGPGSQLARITFDNGSTHAVRIKYVYAPAPYVTPEYGVFRGTDSVVSFDLFFFRDTEVTVEGSCLPSGFKLLDAGYVSSTDHGGTDSPFRIRIAAVAPPDSNRGTLTLSLSAEERSEFLIPYLFLENSGER